MRLAEFQMVFKIKTKTSAAMSHRYIWNINKNNISCWNEKNKKVLGHLENEDEERDNGKMFGIFCQVVKMHSSYFQCEMNIINKIIIITIIIMMRQWLVYHHSPLLII